MHAISYNIQLMKIKFISVIEPRVLECKLWQLSCCTWTYSDATRTGLNCVVDRKPKTVIFSYKHKSLGKKLYCRYSSCILVFGYILFIKHRTSYLILRLFHQWNRKDFFVALGMIHLFMRLIDWCLLFKKKPYFWKILQLGYRICF